MNTVMERAQSLRERHRSHKRQMNFHKRQARLAMIELESFCKAHHLPIIIETDSGEEGEPDHGRIPDRRS